jgi:large subunit ribosomal protein L6
MSRVGKNPIAVPAGVECTLTPKELRAKGKNGQLQVSLTNDVKVELVDGQILVQPASASEVARKMWGTTQRLIKNLIMGVSEGFTKKLELVGVGYRAAMQGNKLVLQLGYSHDIELDVPEGLTVKCEKPTSISIFGADNQKVGQFAAVVRDFRRPEPYKGKGVKYENEYILRKEGKKK